LLLIPDTSYGIMSTLSYLDAYKEFLAACQLIQAQRDYFGAHTYERIDAKGTFHTEWTEKKIVNPNRYHTAELMRSEV